jgi:hypothetical protein
MSGLTLYVWKALPALGQFQGGIAFALASSREEAIDLILADVARAQEGIDASWESHLVWWRGQIREQLQKTEPEICTEAAGSHRFTDK